ncbi:MAG TPA: KamA family radical SAM protein [bacterium]|nr:KamA family radical SAM protein [bacterium]
MNGTAPWIHTIRQGIHEPDDLIPWLDADIQTLRSVTGRYPMRINGYFFRVMQSGGLPLIRQMLPHPLEMQGGGMEDPLAEERDSPVPCVTHRYPDRVLFVVTRECAVYCRFCTRKRIVGRGGPVSDEEIQNGIDYIRSRTEIRDVLVSGGDPLMLADERMEWILSLIRAVPHVEIIRVGTRMPVVLPQRISPELIDVLKRFRPVYIMTHFNHPMEFTDESVFACEVLADAGIPVANQTVLLRGVNDDAPTMELLVRRLLRHRIRPYYIHQADYTQGTDHFRTKISTGISIIKALRGRVSGLAMPYYVLDLPGGGGKIPLVPGYRDSASGRFVNYRGECFDYPEPAGEMPPAWPEPPFIKRN